MEGTSFSVSLIFSKDKQAKFIRVTMNYISSKGKFRELVTLFITANFGLAVIYLLAYIDVQKK